MQNLIGRRVLTEISKRTDTEFKASRVSFSNFRELEISDLYIEDKNKDTLIYASKAIAILDSLNRNERYVSVKSIELTTPIINIAEDDSSVFNFMFIIDSLANPDKPDSLRWKVNFTEIDLYKGEVSLALADKEPLHFSELDISLMKGPNNILIEQIAFGLCNGFHLDRTYADIRMTPNGISVPHLTLTSPYSSIIFKNIAAESLDTLLKDVPAEDLQFKLQSNNSSISGKDISYFFPEEFGFDNSIVIDGNIDGNLAKLNGEDFHFVVDSIIDIYTTFEIRELNDKKEMSFNLELNDLVVNVVEAANFYNKILPNKAIDISPYAHWEQIAYQGNISGVKKNFTTLGKVKTRYGNFNTDVFVALYDSLNSFEYNGDIYTHRFDLGHAIKNPEVIGDASAKLFVTGGKQVDGQFANFFKGEISSLSLIGYEYSGITLEGGVGPGYFNGNLMVDDINANFDFSGKVDFVSSKPSFNFTLDMSHLALSELNLTEAYDKLDLSFKVDSRLTGNRIDVLNGFIDITKLAVETEHNAFENDSIHFGFKPLDAMPSIVLSSEYIDGLILGSYNFSELLGFFNTSFKHHLTALPQVFSKPISETPNKFTFAFEIEDMQDLAATLDFPLRANGFSIVSGNIDSRRNVFTLEGTIPYLLSKNQILDSINIDINSNSYKFDSNIKIKKFSFGRDHAMNNIDISYDFYEDTMFFATTWDNDGEVGYTGDYKANIWLEPYGRELKTIVETQPSEFMISDTLWYLNKHKISIQPKHVNIDSLIFKNSNSYFLLDGVASAELSDTIRFEMDKFNLGNLDRFLSIKNFTFDGLLSGQAELYSLLSHPVFITDIRVDSMSVNNSDWGNLTAITEWDSEQEALELYVDCESLLDGENLLSISGDYYQSNDSLAVDGDFDGFNIAFIQPYLERTLINLTGTGSGHLDLRGSITNPELYGALKVNDGGFRIDYLSTNFYLNDSINFDKGRFVFDATEVTDQEGNIGTVTGDVRHTRYKDMLIDILIESDRFLGINTSAIENEYFFGDIYFGGAITIKSDHTTTMIGSNARTMDGSILTVPLSPVSTASTNNFINYIVKESEIEVVEEQVKYNIKEEKEQPVKELIIDMNFNVTSDATLRLEFDAQSGDVIEATGNGDLNIQFQRGQPFQMFGEYEIEKGDYLFTLQQIFNKKFDIISGSTLRWSGKPGDAIMDITAHYPTRASLYNLMPDAIGESNKNRRVPVNVKMFLTERLSQPDISFDIELPNTDEETQQSVSSIIDTEEEMSRQVLSLLIMNSFYTPDYYTAATGTSQANNQISNVAAVTASEFLSNQLSNWMSQISDNFDLGVRYTPEQELVGEGLTAAEYEVAISTQFFNDRLTVNGNVGYQDYTTATSTPNTNSDFVGEVDVELKLNEHLKLKAYSHQNDDILYENTSMKQGAGITYQEDFTTVKELGGRYKNRIGRVFKGKDKRNNEAIKEDEDDDILVNDDDLDNDNDDTLNQDRNTMPSDSISNGLDSIPGTMTN